MQMKNYSEILQELAKDMDNVSKSMAAVQEHSLNTKDDKWRNSVNQIFSLHLNTKFFISPSLDMQSRVAVLFIICTVYYNTRLFKHSNTDVKLYTQYFHNKIANLVSFVVILYFQHPPSSTYIQHFPWQGSAYSVLLSCGSGYRASLD